MKSIYHEGSIGLFIFTIAGLLIAGGIFLATFITSQKASTPNKYQKLHLPQIQVPTPPTLPATKLIFSSPSAIPTAEPSPILPLPSLNPLFIPETPATQGGASE